MDIENHLQQLAKSKGKHFANAVTLGLRGLFLMHDIGRLIPETERARVSGSMNEFLSQAMTVIVEETANGEHEGVRQEIERIIVLSSATHVVGAGRIAPGGDA